MKVPWSKDKAEKSNATGKAPVKALDAVFAQLRRISVELSELQNTVSVLKRDVARIDRKQYREAAAPFFPSVSPPEVVSDTVLGRAP